MADNLSQTIVGLGYVPVDRGDWEKNYQSNSETRYFNDNIAQYKGSAFIADVTAENAEGNAGTEDSPRYYITAKPYEESVEELNPGWKVFASDAEFAIKYFAQFFTEEENPEFCYVIVDKDKKILFGFHWDGEPYFGVGCPQQIKDYIEKKLAELSLDEYEDIVTFLSDYLGSDTTLKIMIDGINASLEEKVDKVEGKSLIHADYAETKNVIENPEFLEVTADSEDKVLEGIQADGTKVIGGNLNVGGSASISGNIRVLGNMEVSGVSYKIVENSEYLAAWVDAEDKVIFGFKTDGKTYIGDAGFLNEIKNNQEAINEIKSYLANLDIDALSSITTVENPEYIDVKVDSEDKILEGITTDGIKKINIPVDNGAAIIETTDNPEFLEAKVDAEGKLIEGINKNGEKIFGVIPPQIKQYIDENMPAGGSGVSSIEYDEETGDMYATYDDEGGITDVSMEPNGDIYVEYEE